MICKVIKKSDSTKFKKNVVQELKYNKIKTFELNKTICENK